MGDVGNIPSTPRDPMTIVNTPYVASFTPDGGGKGLMTIDMLVTGDVTFANPVNMFDGQRFALRLRCDGSNHTISFGTAYRGSSDTPLASFSLLAGTTEYRAFEWNGAASKVDYLANNKGFT